MQFFSWILLALVCIGLSFGDDSTEEFHEQMNYKGEKGEPGFPGLPGLPGMKGQPGTDCPKSCSEPKTERQMNAGRLATIALMDVTNLNIKMDEELGKISERLSKLEKKEL